MPLFTIHHIQKIALTKAEVVLPTKVVLSMMIHCEQLSQLYPGVDRKIHLWEGISPPVPSQNFSQCLT